MIEPTRIVSRLLMAAAPFCAASADVRIGAIQNDVAALNAAIEVAEAWLRQAIMMQPY